MRKKKNEKGSPSLLSAIAGLRYCIVLYLLCDSGLAVTSAHVLVRALVGGPGSPPTDKMDHTSVPSVLSRPLGQLYRRMCVVVSPQWTVFIGSHNQQDNEHFFGLHTLAHSKLTMVSFGNWCPTVRIGRVIYAPPGAVTIFIYIHKHVVKHIRLHWANRTWRLKPHQNSFANFFFFKSCICDCNQMKNNSREQEKLHVGMIAAMVFVKSVDLSKCFLARARHPASSCARLRPVLHNLQVFASTSQALAGVHPHGTWKMWLMMSRSNPANRPGNRGSHA